jgi:effector-binding domain-containing protein
VTDAITIGRVAPRPLAAVARRVPIREVATSWRAPLDQVWAFLRSHPGLRTDGHNVFLYRHPVRREDPMDVAFGLEVAGPFDGDGEVLPMSTPGGEVAALVHRGGYDTLGAAHDAIHAWRVEAGRRFAGVSWEIYGDPDPATGAVEVRIEYLLASDRGEVGREG